MSDYNPAANPAPGDDSPEAAKARRIKDKIAASTARNSGKAAPRLAMTADADSRVGPDERSFFTRTLEDHPLALIAGGVVMGAVAASFVPASTTRKFTSRALGFAAMVGEMTALYGGKALEKSSEAPRAGQDRLEDLGETAADYSADARTRAIELGTLAARRAIEMATEAAGNARGGSSGLLQRLSEFVGDLKDRNKS